jgi:hypothetical protein
MPIKKIKAAKKAIIAGLDMNGDGVIDRKDAIVAARIIGAETIGAGATALVSATAGSAIVAIGATAIATKVTAVAGGAAGAFIAATFGTATATISVLAVGHSSLLLASTTVTSAVGAKILAASSGAGVLLAQEANGTVAGFPVIQSIAISNAVAAPKVILVAGIPMAVNVTIAAGLTAIVIVGGYAYYLLTKDRLADSGRLSGVPVLA